MISWDTDDTLQVSKLQVTKWIKSHTLVTDWPFLNQLMKTQTHLEPSFQLQGPGPAQACGVSSVSGSKQPVVSVCCYSYQRWHGLTACFFRLICSCGSKEHFTQKWKTLSSHPLPKESEMKFLCLQNISAGSQHTALQHSLNQLKKLGTCFKRDLRSLCVASKIQSQF